MTIFRSSLQTMEALSAPMGDLIASVGRSIAEAQRALDLQSIENFLLIYREGGEVLQELREIGYQPTWYQIPEANAELVIALTVTGEGSDALVATGGVRSRRMRIYGAPMNGGYTGRYNYEISATSKINFRVVPIPPPAPAEEMRVAPEVIGATIAAARTGLATAQIELLFAADTESIENEAVITAQQPAPGDVVSGGGAIVVRARVEE